MTGKNPQEAFRIDPELLLRAYATGVFPMAEEADNPEIFWVRPEKRGVLPFENFHVSRSLRKTVRQGRFDIRYDTDFTGVITGCASGSGCGAHHRIEPDLVGQFEAISGEGSIHAENCSAVTESWQQL